MFVNKWIAQMKLSIFVKRYLDSITLVVLICGVHGIILLNDGIYWDDWLIYRAQAQGDWDGLFSYFDNLGAPVTGYIHNFLLQLPASLFIYRFINLGSWLVIGLSIFQTAKKMNLVSHTEAWFIAAITSVYPAYELLFTMIMLPFHLFMAAYFLGIYIFVAIERADGTRPLALATLSIVAMCIGFLLNSLIPFHLGFFIIFVFYKAHQKKKNIADFSFLSQFVREYGFLIFLPLLMWGLTRTLAPIRSEYNGILFSPNILSATLTFLQAAILEQINSGLIILFQNPLILGLFIIFLYQVLIPRFKVSETSTSVITGLLFIFGLGWFLLSIFAYLAVNKTPAVDGWWTRYMLLVALPLSICIIAISRWARSMAPRLDTLILSIFVALFAFMTLDSYMNYQARWAKDYSVIKQMQLMPEYQDVSVMWVQDHYPVGNENRYRPYEWDGFMAMAWGGYESRVGLFSVQDPQSYIQLAAEDDKILDSGCQGIISIDKGPRPLLFTDEWGIAVRYLVFNTVLPGGFNDYLLDLTDIQIERVVAPQASDCKRQNDLLLSSSPTSVYFQDISWNKHIDYLNIIEYLWYQSDELFADENKWLDLYNQQSLTLVYQSYTQDRQCLNEEFADLVASFGFSERAFIDYCIIESLDQVLSLEAQAN